MKFKLKTSVIYFIYLTLKEERALEKRTLGYEKKLGDFCFILQNSQSCMFVVEASLFIQKPIQTRTDLQKRFQMQGGYTNLSKQRVFFFFQCALLCHLLMCLRKACLNKSPEGRQRIWHTSQCETSSHMWTHSDQTRVTAVSFSTLQRCFNNQMNCSIVYSPVHFLEILYKGAC